MSNKTINILGTGSYAPEFIADNDMFSKIVETNDEWITTRTGIKTRHISNKEPTYKMGAIAAQQALNDAGLDISDIDMIIVSTITNDFYSPSTACLVGHELNAGDIPCYDINAACAGYVTAIDIAKKYLESGEYGKILIVASEMLSRITDFTDRSTCVLFGDGAGAAVLSLKDGIYSNQIGSDTQGIYKIFAKSTPLNNPFCDSKTWEGEESLDYGNGSYLYMEGKDVYKFATSVMPMAVEKACEKAGISPADLNLIIPHQANIRIVQTAAKNLNLSMDKFFVNVDKYGNTSSASVAICLDEAKKQGFLKKGDKIALVGFGAGLVYACTIFEY